MDRKQFRDWISRVDELSAAQRSQAAAVLSSTCERDASLAAVELGVDDARRCPRCSSEGAVSRGKARGLRLYRCKACGKSFGALAGTTLARLHYKERWLAFGASLAEGETIREAAELCGIAPSAAFRWRHRFLAAVRQKPNRLSDLVEPDETFVFESREGWRSLGRKPRRRGGKARKRGISSEQMPILVAIDRSRATLSHALPAFDAESVKRPLEPVVPRDAMLPTDGGSRYPPVSAALSISRERINRSAGERIRGALHIQTVNNRHSRIKDILRGFRGIATKNLDSYLRWFHLAELGNSPRQEHASMRQWVAHACVLQIVLFQYPDIARSSYGVRQPRVALPVRKELRRSVEGDDPAARTRPGRSLQAAPTSSAVCPCDGPLYVCRSQLRVVDVGLE